MACSRTRHKPFIKIAIMTENRWNWLVVYRKKLNCSEELNVKKPSVDGLNNFTEFCIFLKQPKRSRKKTWFSLHFTRMTNIGLHSLARIILRRIDIVLMGAHGTVWFFPSKENTKHRVHRTKRFGASPNIESSMEVSEKFCGYFSTSINALKTASELNFLMPKTQTASWWYFDGKNLCECTLLFEILETEIPWRVTLISIAIPYVVFLKYAKSTVNVLNKVDSIIKFLCFLSKSMVIKAPVAEQNNVDSAVIMLNLLCCRKKISEPPSMVNWYFNADSLQYTFVLMNGCVGRVATTPSPSSLEL